MKNRSDSGYATIAVAILILSFVAIAAVITMWVRVHLAGHRAQVAADLGAVSAARALDCEAGGRTVSANGAAMLSCGLFEGDAVVEALVTAGPIRVSRVARAGPIQESMP
ncbi:MAG: flp pilus-assembly TadE/G-like family protein [Corynebacterium sp.]|nr:flp pilus-assembly TadE/G-like family protein [Corynebacterium sp.]